MTFRSSSGLTGGNGANAVIPVPTGAQTGDIVVVGIYKESTSTITGVATGFTLKTSLTTSATARGSLYVYWKRLTANDTGSYTFSWSGSTFKSGCAVAHSGRVATGDPFDGTVGTAESTTTVATLNVSTSPASANGDAVGFWTNFTGGNSYTPPSGYTERQDLDVITVDTQDAVASGSTGSISATSNVSGFQKAFLGVLAEASSGFTGTAAITEDGDTSSASGQLGYTGTAAVTQAAQTSSASGSFTSSGFTGTAAITQQNQTSSASGQLGYSGTAAPTQANQTASASGKLGYSGTAVVTQANQTASATGKLGYTGTSATTQAAQVSTASGTYTSAGSFTGSAAVTQADQTSTATGKLGYSGTLATTQANQAASAAGTVTNPVTGTAAVTQANQIATASGSFAALVSFGVATAATGSAPSARGATANVPHASAGSSGSPTARSASGSVPTATGG